MKIANTLFATVAMVAFAAPAFAQTLSEDPSSASSAVTTTVKPACALEGELSLFSVGVSPNGEITAPAPQTLTVTCNTPMSIITIGSDDMVNNDAPDIVETDTFTNVIKFTGQADGLTGGAAWRLDSRENGALAFAATVGFDTDRRIRPLVVSIEGAAPAGGLLPVAGSYSGTICVTVDPSGSIGGPASPDGDSSCTPEV